MSGSVGWKPILEVFDHLWRSALGFGMGWFLWSMNGPDWPFFIIFAALCALGGAIRLVKALWVLVRVILRNRDHARYRRQGADPKADKLADVADLKRRGLIK